MGATFVTSHTTAFPWRLCADLAGHLPLPRRPVGATLRRTDGDAGVLRRSRGRSVPRDIQALFQPVDRPDGCSVVLFFILLPVLQRHGAFQDDDGSLRGAADLPRNGRLPRGGPLPAAARQGVYGVAARLARPRTDRRLPGHPPDDGGGGSFTLRRGQEQGPPSGLQERVTPCITISPDVSSTSTAAPAGRSPRAVPGSSSPASGWSGRGSSPRRTD